MTVSEVYVGAQRVAQSFDRRVPIVILLLLLIAASFWLGSRYPALNEKALMGGATPFAGLAFDVLIEVLPDTSFWWEVAANTINWVYTNWKGMAFGVLFGGCLLTAVELLPRRSFNHGFADAALGTAIGAPLGVCVNCAAPIAQGLHSAGARLETTLAALIASPTLNVIVVSMSFALLPFHLALVKLVAMLGFVLIGIPILCRYFLNGEESKQSLDGVCELPGAQVSQSRIQRLQERLKAPAITGAASQNFVLSLVWVARSFGGNLAFIAVITVPLMFVAGALGSLIVTAVPFEAVNDSLLAFDGVVGNALALVALAFFAILLPVPIAFDVIIVTVLINAGWSDHFSMVMLLGLGSFSVYSMFIIGRAISYRVALTMMAALAGVAVLSGIAVHQIKPIATAAVWKNVEQLAVQAKPLVLPTIVRSPALALPAINQRRADNPIRRLPMANPVRHSGKGQIALSGVVLAASDQVSIAGSSRFSLLQGSDIGLNEEARISTLRQFEPFTYFSPITAGDIDGDGWDDIVMGSDVALGGLSIYANVGGRFVRQSVELGLLADSFVSAVALVDLNNDGQPDLFVSTFLEGAYVLWNEEGSFSSARMATLPNGDSLMLSAPGFADLDGDGDLDIVAGNWAGGTLIRFEHDTRAADHVLWNEQGSFTKTSLPGIPGETLTTLITDINGDEKPDILIGDDSFGSDKVYLNQGERNFRLLKKSTGQIPWLTRSTMSLDTGDFDNDGRLDLYSAQTTSLTGGTASNHRADSAFCRSGMVDIHGNADQCFLDMKNRTEGFHNASPLFPKCDVLGDSQAKEVCAVRSILMRTAKDGEIERCSLLPDGWPYANRLCTALTPDHRIADAIVRFKEMDSLPAIIERNVLLQRNADGNYKDVTGAQGVERPGWSWNTKFVDLDQDGWQDLFVATGYLPSREYRPNAYYRNVSGSGFAFDAEAFGLADAIPTSAFVLLDYDRDGDVDIVRAPSVAGPLVHRHDNATGSSLWVQLFDEIGNSQGIGARVSVVTEDSITQVRQVKASGGFISFDPIKAHFGLGDSAFIAEITVAWPDGAITKIKGPILPNSELAINRRH